MLYWGRFGSPDNWLAPLGVYPYSHVLNKHVQLRAVFSSVGSCAYSSSQTGHSNHCPIEIFSYLGPYPTFSPCRCLATATQLDRSVIMNPSAHTGERWADLAHDRNLTGAVSVHLWWGRRLRPRYYSLQRQSELKESYHHHKSPHTLYIVLCCFCFSSNL